MSDDLRQLVNILERALEDLANARVLVDGALRRVEDQVQDFHFWTMLRRRGRGVAGKALGRTAAGNGQVGPPDRRLRNSAPSSGTAP
jgi:hypothetical protein